MRVYGFPYCRVILYIFLWVVFFLNYLLKKKGEDSLQFFWQEFGKDFTFIDCNIQGQEKLGFHLMMKNYNIKNISLALALGLNEPIIIEILQKAVYNIFLNHFSY